jgi:hypothetical protein
MINNEEGKRFTDDAYATQAEVKAVYNQEDISDIWEKIRSYRFFFDTETDLRDTAENPYKLCLTKKLLKASYSLEVKLIQDLLLCQSLSEESRAAFLLAQKVKALMATAKNNAIDIKADETFTKIATGTLESIPSSYFLLNSYSHAYDKARVGYEAFVPLLETINKAILGESETDSVKYRKDNPSDAVNPLQAPQGTDIPLHLAHLESFLRQEDVPAILKSLVILYVFDSLRPFEFVNAETAALGSKAFLSGVGFSALGFTLDFESIAYSHSDRFFARLKESETTLDLTYFLQSVFPFIVHNELTLSQELQGFLEKDKAAKATTPTPNLPVTEEISIVESSSLALPVFPTGADAAGIDDIAKKLLEVHPQLKRKQAHFYAGHCTVGLHYTIDQFRAGEQTVYETARTSMEDLANRGFYKKEKIGNKFVYSPIPMKEGSPS